MTKTILVRSQGRIIIPQKISLYMNIWEGTTLTFIEPKSKFEKKGTVQLSGRVVIPNEIRAILDIVPNTTLFLAVNDKRSMTAKTLVEKKIFLIKVNPKD